MSKDIQKKTEKEVEPSVYSDTPAGRMRRLADAIDALLGNPITVRMSPLWSCVENDEDRRRLSPTDAQKYAAEEEKLRKSHGRHKELKAAFAAARLDLQEDEAVFLEGGISCLPDTWVDAWTHADDMSDETFGKLRGLGIGLRHRADVAGRGVAKVGTQRPVEQTTLGAALYKIERRGKRTFAVTFEGGTFEAGGVGMLYVVTFFRYAARRKSEDPDPLSVMTESWGTTPDQQANESSGGSYESAESRTQWTRDKEQAARFVRDSATRLKRLRALKDREQDLDDDELRELTALEKTIGDSDAYAKEIRKQLAIRDGKHFVAGDDRTKARGTMLRAINRTLKNIRKRPADGIPVADDARQAAKRFEDHIRTYLTRGNLKSYTPPPGVSWLLPD